MSVFFKISGTNFLSAAFVYIVYMAYLCKKYQNYEYCISFSIYPP